MPRRSGRRRALLGVLGLTIAISVGGFALQGQASPRGAELLHDAISLISRASPDPVSPGELYEAAAEGLVRELKDPYSELLSPEELEMFRREAMGNYGGVGMLIESVDGAAVVMQVYPQTPAAERGVQSGDRIVSVAGEPVAGLTLDGVSERLRGRPGSPVRVEFDRGDQRLAFDLERRTIQVPSVPFATLVEPGVGYVPIRSFGPATGREVGLAALELRARGARALILDLRGNGGGQLDQAIAVSNLFLPRGEQIASVAYRNQPDESYTAERPPLSTDVPLAVLIDGGSASASEIVAGSLQDHDRALVVGSRSFGKGLVQQLFPLEGGWVLKLTTGRWVTPSGRSIQRPRDPRGRPLDADTAAAERPVFRTAAGRAILGGGGITPDVVVDHPSDPQVAQLVRLLGPRLGEFQGALSATAHELRGTLGPDFRVDAAMRDRLHRRLSVGGVSIEPAQLDSVGALLDRLLAERVSSRLFGEEAAFRRGLARDAQLQQVIERLRGAPTPAALLGLG